MDCDNIILKKSAVQNESTLNPPTILSHNRDALITNKNNPKVSTVIGRVKITKIGLIKH
jgi:hypothetical protein